MSRCAIGKKKLAKLAIKTGLPVIAAFVRGGTDHRVDLLLSGGSIVHLYKNGSLGNSTLTHDRSSSQF